MYACMYVGGKGVFIENNQRKHLQCPHVRQRPILPYIHTATYIESVCVGVRWEWGRGGVKDLRDLSARSNREPSQGRIQNSIVYWHLNTVTFAKSYINYSRLTEHTLQYTPHP